MKNDSPKEITPKVDVLFFDKTSNQTGFFQIGSNPYGLKGDVLEKDEVRSITGTIAISNPDAMPAYYLLKTIDE